MSLQLRQVGTNICQCLTPIIGLLLIVLLQKIASSNISKYLEKPIYSGLPFMFNLPYQQIGGTGLLFNISTCEQWYLYQFDEEAKEGSVENFGYNKGEPIYRPKSDGMINGQTGVLQSACPDIGRTTPYF